MFQLSAEFGFVQIAKGETPILKVTLLLPKFPLFKLLGESNDHFIACIITRNFVSFALNWRVQ
jgi:hypothetical protein